MFHDWLLVSILIWSQLSPPTILRLQHPTITLIHFYWPGSSLVVLTTMITPDHLPCHWLTLDILTNTFTNTTSTLSNAAFSHAPATASWPCSATQAPCLHRTDIPCPCTPALHPLIPSTTSGPSMATHVCMTTSCNPYLALPFGLTLALGHALWPCLPSDLWHTL